MTMTITIVENPNGTYTSTPDCQERLCRELYRNSRCKDGEFKDSSASALAAIVALGISV